MAVETVLSIGSNCGDRCHQVESGIEWLKSVLSCLRSSSIYSTMDCNGGKRDYFNAVVSGYTAITMESLDKMCKQYELSHGRTSDARKKGDVPIDIDIVIYDTEIIREKDFSQIFFKIGYDEITYIKE